MCCSIIERELEFHLERWIAFMPAKMKGYSKEQGFKTEKHVYDQVVNQTGQPAEGFWLGKV
jgi:hypothetical protein